MTPPKKDDLRVRLNDAIERDAMQRHSRDESELAELARAALDEVEALRKNPIQAAVPIMQANEVLNRENAALRERVKVLEEALRRIQL